MARTFAAFHISTRMIHGLSLRPAKRGWAVAAGASLPAPDDDQQDLGPIFKSLGRQIKLGGRQPVTLVLGKQQAIIRSVQLPSIDRAELVQMARFEAERHIPFNAERHCVGFHVMRSKGVEGSEVLLGAVDGPVVQRGVDALTASGCIPDGVTLSSTCLVNSLRYHQQEAFGQQTQAIVSLGLDALDLVFLSQGRVLYARSVAVDLRGVLEGWIGHPAEGATRPDPAKLAMAAHMIDCAKLEETEGAAPLQRWIERLGQEIQRTYDFARREMKCPAVERIWLTGEGAALRGLDRLLAEGGQIAIEVLNPVGGLPGAEKANFPFHGLEFAVAFGAVLGQNEEGAYRLDLTPTTHYAALAKKALVRRLILSGVLLLIAIGLGTFAWMDFQQRQAALLDDYKDINKSLKPVAAQLQAKETKTAIIRQFIEDPNAALTVFDSITAAPMVPGNVYLEKVAFEKGKSVSIEGKAKTIQDITAFVDYLEKTGHFEKVVRGGSQPTNLLGRPVVNFTLDCPLRVNGSDAASGGKK